MELWNIHDAMIDGTTGDDIIGSINWNHEVEARFCLRGSSDTESYIVELLLSEQVWKVRFWSDKKRFIK